jgi:hypothetical protein
MSDGENRESDTNPGPESSPSLSGLAERVKRNQDRKDHTMGDTLPSESDNNPEGTPGTDEDSGFLFPADTRSGDEQAGGTPPAVADTAGETPLDGADDTDEPEERFGPDAKTEAIIELIGDTPNLLLMGPSHSPADYDLCANLLVPQDDPPENLLLVTFEKSPDERLNILEGHLGTLPDNIAMLNVGDATRSGSSDIVSTPNTEGIQVDNLSDSTDIQRMGLAINKYLSQWDGDGETALCFHSLSALLETVEPQTVFRFLNVLLGRVRSGNVRAHYHIDPVAHDDQTLETYRPLFDERIRVEEDGSVSIDR